MGGNADVQQNAVHAGDLQIPENLLDLAEIGMDQGHPVFPGQVAIGIQNALLTVIADEHGGIAGLFIALGHIMGTKLTAAADFGSMKVGFNFIHGVPPW